MIDSDVIVASFLELELNHERGREIVEGLENGECDFYLPTLAIVEVASAIRRRSRQHWMAMLAVWNQNVLDWEDAGKLAIYPLDRIRMGLSVSVARRIGLRGADSVIAALSEELDIPLKTFDNEIIDRFALASP